MFRAPWWFCTKLRNICWKLQKAAPQSCCGPPPKFPWSSCLCQTWEQGQIYGWATRLTRLIGGPPSQTHDDSCECPPATFCIHHCLGGKTSVIEKTSQWTLVRRGRQRTYLWVGQTELQVSQSHHACICRNMNSILCRRGSKMRCKVGACKHKVTKSTGLFPTAGFLTSWKLLLHRKVKEMTPGQNYSRDPCSKIRPHRFLDRTGNLCRCCGRNICFVSFPLKAGRRNNLSPDAVQCNVWVTFSERIPTNSQRYHQYLQYKILHT